MNAYNHGWACLVIIIIITSSCARSARFATCARNSLCSLCHCALQLILCGVDSVSLLPHSTYTCIGLHDDKPITRYKDVSDRIVIAMGTVVPMSKVEDLVIRSM